MKVFSGNYWLRKTLHTYNKTLEIALTIETAEQGTKGLKEHDKLQTPEDLYTRPVATSHTLLRPSS